MAVTDATDQLYERLLVVRSQLGDKAALAELVARYAPKLRYLVGRMLASPAGVNKAGVGDTPVNDLVQDIWLDIVRALPRLAAAEAFKTWLYRIARDRVYGQLRKHRRLPRPLDNEREIAAEPDDAAFDAEDIAAVHAGLAELPCEQREALVLRFVEGMSYEEIAVATGTPVGTVRSRLHYGKQALRKRINRERSHVEK
jgi:RNA polymerase sigma-70 factor (ECF subfamily)